MSTNKKRKFSKPPRKHQREYKKRSNLPTGAHFTLYDIRGDAISPEVVSAVESVIQDVVQEANLPHIAMDVRTS